MEVAAILKIVVLTITNQAIFPILAKFGTRKQNGMSTRATWQKLQIFEIQDGGRLPFWKSLNRHYVSEKSSDFDEIR